MDLSVVIVSYNTHGLLEDCLRSVFSHTPKLQMEVFVVDNGSSDGSPDIVENKFPEANLIRNEHNLGYSAANNQAIRRSRGRYILLLNSDTVVLDNSFDLAVNYMDLVPDTGVLGCKLVDQHGDWQPTISPFLTIRRELLDNLPLGRFLLPKQWLSRTFLTEPPGESLEVDVVQGAFLLVRRQVVDLVGLLDENFFLYCEEQDWCRRIKAQGWKVVYYRGPKVVHYGGQSSGSGSSPRSYQPDNFIELCRSKYKFFRKHHGLVPALFYLLALKVELSIRSLKLGVMLVRSGRKGSPHLLRQLKGYWGVIIMGVPTYQIDSAEALQRSTSPE